MSSKSPSPRSPMGGEHRDPVTQYLISVPLDRGLVVQLRRHYTDSDIEKIAFCEARKYLKTKLIDDPLSEETYEELTKLSAPKDLKRLKTYDPPNISLSSFEMNLEYERGRPPFGFQQ